MTRSLLPLGLRYGASLYLSVRKPKYSGDKIVPVQAVPVFRLEQFALELLIGATKNSDWLDGKLVIDANHGPIHLLQAAFYAVRLEVQRRGDGVCC